MSELDEVLVRALDDGDRALAGERLGADGLAVLTGRIRARRARRRAVQVALVLPVAAAVVVGAATLLDRLDAPAPSATQPTGPAPSATPAPTSGRSPSPDPRPGADPVLLPDEPGLPSRYELPDGLLATTTPGWVLAVYTPSTADRPPGQAVVVLAAPDGTTYEVTRVPIESAQSAVRLELADWRAGSSTALLERRDTDLDGAEHATVVELDLATGAVTSAAPVLGAEVLEVSTGLTAWYDPSAHELLLDTASGRATYGPWGPGVLDPSPDGRYVLADTTVVDTRTGDPVDEIQGLRDDGWCLPLTWWSSDEVLASCTDDDPSAWDGAYLDLHPRLVALTVGADLARHGAAVRTLGAGDPYLFAWYPTHLADGEVVLQGRRLAADTSTLGDLCPDGSYLVRADGSVRAVPTDLSGDSQTVFRSAAAAGRVLTQASGGCVYDAPQGPLYSYDPATGRTGTVLGPVAGGEAWLGTHSSWVVGR